VNANQVIVLATVVGTLVAVVSLIIAIRSQAQKAAADEAQAKQDTYNRGVVDGKTSRDDEMRQLTFERDDAKADFARAERRAEEYERRYLDLRERRGP
jgi:hypothetical protein